MILTSGNWLNQPKSFQLGTDKLVMTTEPNTDFWQRSYYGFKNDNAPAYLFNSADNFTFTVKAEFEYQCLFDQCGVIIYIDSDNWFKASIEYENNEFARLGSVVTNYGYSDWATQDIKLPTTMWYRLSRRGPDFLIESSFDGNHFTQMRIFHLHSLGKTTLKMGQAEPALPAINSINVGVYACSPENSCFKSTFSDFKYGKCQWAAHAQ